MSSNYTGLIEAKIKIAAKKDIIQKNLQPLFTVLKNNGDKFSLETLTYLTSGKLPNEETMQICNSMYAAHWAYKETQERDTPYYYKAQNRYYDYCRRMFGAAKKDLKELNYNWET